MKVHPSLSPSLWVALPSWARSRPQGRMQWTLCTEPSYWGAEGSPLHQEECPWDVAGWGHRRAGGASGRVDSP